MSGEPSWWKYVGGLDADRIWAARYVSSVREGLQVSLRDREFYLSAIERLAVSAYRAAANRPPDALNFWLVCHYLLGSAAVTGKSRKAAALDTATLASSSDRASGHGYKAIQRYATKLEKPASEFLAAIWQELPVDWNEPGIGERVVGALTVWVETMAQKVA